MGKRDLKKGIPLIFFFKKTCCHDESFLPLFILLKTKHLVQQHLAQKWVMREAIVSDKRDLAQGEEEAERRKEAERR